MSPLNDQQLNQIRDERREQIKKAALKVFALHGLVGTKMNMIANEAGISQGLSYRYYSSKDELFIELVQEAMEETADAFASLGYMKGSPTEIIKTLTTKMLDGSNRHSFMLIQQVQTSDEVPDKAKEIVQRYSTTSFIEQLIPIFKNGQEKGEFCKGDPAALMILYFSVLSGLMLLQTGEMEQDHVPDIHILMKMLR
ncbi:TetR/AcrR family transcriptional regulator [Neobacillus niacini]|uniref:TetR/AcrR family transcriptional regulator n=1 Tax=Neobacillus niacini TaxID=86668 RepID=UPI0005EE5DFB|nr:TetR/AcrR family transcriptional regulator [Neobacillus niacini]